MNRIKWFDSVRVFGFLLVLIYHLFYYWLPGGFFGVDIFFTFSGFLITSMILGEVSKRRKFNLFGFLKRRMQRIVVPLFFAVIFTLPFMLLISPDFTVNIAKQVASSLSLSSNWYNIIIGSSYEAQMLPQMYVHTWALAVIVQFYLAWGVICALVVVLFRAVTGNGNTKLFGMVKTTLLALSGALAVCSFIYLIHSYNAGRDLNFIYFNTFSRIFPFFIGSIAAAIWGINAKQDKKLKKRFFSKRRKLKAFSLIATALLAAAVVVAMSARLTFDDPFTYRYGFLAVSLLTIVLIYCMHGLHLLTPQSVKEPKALNIASELSYDIYLYHWPINVIVSALMINDLYASVLTIILTLFISAIMVYGVQRVLMPQGNGIKHKYRKAAVIAISIPVVAAIAAGGVVVARAPAITSIESDFASGFIIQDTRWLLSLSEGIEDMNTAPVIYAGAASRIQPNLLPLSSERPTAAQIPETPDEPGSAIGNEPEASPSPSPEPLPTPTPERPQAAPPVYTTAPSPELSSELSSELANNPDSSQLPANIPAGVSIIGDSVSLGAQAALLNTIPNCVVDSAVSRPLRAGEGIISTMQSRGQLREYVVIALGTNGTNNYAALITNMIEIIEPGHRIIFVAPYDGNTNNNARAVENTVVWMRDLPSQYSYVTIADWNALISTQRELLAGDRVHMGGNDSRALYADLIVEAIGVASRKPAK